MDLPPTVETAAGSACGKNQGLPIRPVEIRRVAEYVAVARQRGRRLAVGDDEQDVRALVGKGAEANEAREECNQVRSRMEVRKRRFLGLGGLGPVMETQESVVRLDRLLQLLEGRATDAVNLL